MTPWHYIDDMRKAQQSKRFGEESSDGELLGVSEKDGEAFAIFYDRHVRAILGFFYRKTACPETAGDLTSETFSQAFLSRKRYRDRGGRSARAWLLRIAERQFYRALRRGAIENRARQRLGVDPVAMDEVSYERVEELADFGPIREELNKALHSLSPRVADALQLRIGLQLPYNEVARYLDCSEVAARARVARGLSQLTDLMEVTQ